MTNPFLEAEREPDGTILVFVQLPAAIDPDERETHFGQPLDAELRLAGIGYVSGGGMLHSAEDAEGNREIIFAGVDVGHDRR